MSTQGKTAFVTGANRGIGAEVAEQLAALGYEVISTARDAEGCRQLDVADEASVLRLAGELSREGVTLHAVVNNAGASFDGFDAGVARRTLEVNYRGPRRVVDALAPLLAGGASVVNVSSGMGELSAYPAALRGRFADSELDRAALDALLEEFVTAVADGRHVELGWPSNAYRVSKTGLNALTRLQARELAARGIRVNAVCPGWVRTDMGGSSATRSVREGAKGVVWAATLPPDGPSGGFFRDGRRIEW